MILWTLQHLWSAGSRFTLNCYRHWAQLLLCQPGDATSILLSREGVNQSDPLLMVLYGITLIPLSEELRDADTTIMSPFYANDALFDGLARRSAVQLRLLMEQGPDQR